MRRPLAVATVDATFPAITRHVVQTALGTLAPRVESVQYDVNIEGLEHEDGTPGFDSILLLEPGRTTTSAMEQYLERIEMALGAMTRGGTPKPSRLSRTARSGFRKGIAGRGRRDDRIVLSADPNQPARLLFSNLLRTWDNVKEASWTRGADRNTRRAAKADPRITAFRPGTGEPD